MPFAFDHGLIGVGSMCRRHVGGPNGILRVVDELDRALGPEPCLLHLFGVKAQGMAAVRGHPRVASFDSQAYGVGCRKDAWRAGVSKTDALLARYMTAWYCEQVRRLAEPGYAFRVPPCAPSGPARRVHPVEARIATAAERLRELREAGEIDWTDVSPLAAYEMAFIDDEESFDEVTKLYDPRSGFGSLEAMHWLGHVRLESGQHYIELSPVRLMTAFHRSSKLTEEMRCVRALVDGHLDPGGPVLRYDVGHGWCKNPAYAACAHRTTCWLTSCARPCRSRCTWSWPSRRRSGRARSRCRSRSSTACSAGPSATWSPG